MPELMIEKEASHYERNVEQIINGPGFDAYEFTMMRHRGQREAEINQFRIDFENLLSDDQKKNLATLDEQRTKAGTGAEQIQASIDAVNIFLTISGITPEQTADLNQLGQDLENLGKDSAFFSVKEKQLEWERAIEASLHRSVPTENFEQDFNGKKELWRSAYGQDIDKISEPPVSIEQVRLYLALILQPPLRRFFQEQCVLRHTSDQQEQPGFPRVGSPRDDLQSPEHTGGINVVKNRNLQGEDCFVIQCDTETFMKRTPEGARYLDLTQFGLTFVKTLLQLLPKQEKKEEELREELLSGRQKSHKKIISGQQENEAVIDFLALAAVDREQAEKLSKDAYIKASEYFRALERFTREELSENAHAVLDRFGGTFWQQRMMVNQDLQVEDRDSLRTGDRVVKAFNKRLDRSFNTWLGFALGRINPNWSGRIQFTWTGFYETDWYERAKAELDDKEAARILKRDIHVTLRDKELKQAIARSDREAARWLLLADASTSDYMTWRMNLYLYHFDYRFKQTNGKEITPESFDLLMRLHRISYKTRMLGTKPGEYELSRDGTYASLVPYEQQVHNAWEEIDKFSARNIMSVPDETWEWLKYATGKDSPYIGWKDKLGEGDRSDPNYWLVPTGDIREMTPDAEGYVEFIRRARGETGDDEFGTKLDAFRKAILAYCHHMVMSEKGYPTHEHSPPAAGKATAYYGNHYWANATNQKKYTEHKPFMKQLNTVHESSPYKSQFLLKKLFGELSGHKSGNGRALARSSSYNENYSGVPTSRIQQDYELSKGELEGEGKRPSRQDIRGEFTDAQSEFENQYATNRIEQFVTAILPENLPYLEYNALNTEYSGLLKDLRTNSPGWYQNDQNQFKVQRYAGDLLARVPELRQAAQAQAKLKPYVEAVEASAAITPKEIPGMLQRVYRLTEEAWRTKEQRSEHRALSILREDFQANLAEIIPQTIKDDLNGQLPDEDRLLEALKLIQFALEKRSSDIQKKEKEAKKEGGQPLEEEEDDSSGE